MMASVRAWDPTTLVFTGKRFIVASGEFEVGASRVRDPNAGAVGAEIGFGVAGSESRDESRTDLVRALIVCRVAASLALVSMPISHQDLPSLHVDSNACVPTNNLDVVNLKWTSGFNDGSPS